MGSQIKDSNAFIILIILLGDNKNITNTSESLEIQLEKIKKSKGQIPYDDLTKIIYNDKKLLGKVISTNDITSSIDSHKDFISKNYSTNANLQDYLKYLDKIKTHVSLAVVQREFIQSIYNDSEQEIKKITDDMAFAMNELEGTKKELVTTKKAMNLAEDNLNSTKGTIYTEFIAILGIFSALIFGLFGGFQGISQAVSSLVDHKNIGYLLVASSTITMCLTLLIFGLLQWVARISGRRLVSCDCLSENKRDCKHSLFSRHKTFFSIFLPLLVCFFIGLYLLYIKYLVDKKLLTSGWITGESEAKLVLCLFPFAVIVIVLITIYMVFRKKK